MFQTIIQTIDKLTSDKKTLQIDLKSANTQINNLISKILYKSEKFNCLVSDNSRSIIKLIFKI